MAAKDARSTRLSDCLVLLAPFRGYFIGSFFINHGLHGLTRIKPTAVKFSSYP
jgi:hypothetical protein